VVSIRHGRWRRTINDCRIAIFPASAKKALNLFFPPQTKSQGDLLPVCRRADLSRTMTLVVAPLLTAVSTGAFARDFRAADARSEDYPTVEALRYMGSLVAERSGGRHQMKMFHSRQLGEEKESLEQTGAGAIDLNRTNVALIGTMAPSVNVLAMPFLFRSIEHLQRVLDGLIGNEILDSFEPYGFVGPAFNESGARSKVE
jgi:TRAP-type C4-dicarboxylate transport system substrate-binding protein